MTDDGLEYIVGHLRGIKGEKAAYPLEALKRLAGESDTHRPVQLFDEP